MSKPNPELAKLKSEATKLGIEFPNNITIEQLQEKIDVHVEEQMKIREYEKLTPEEVLELKIKERKEKERKEKELRAKKIAEKRNELVNGAKRVEIRSNIEQDGQFAQSRQHVKRFTVSNKYMHASNIVNFSNITHVCPLILNVIKKAKLTINTSNELGGSNSSGRRLQENGNIYGLANQRNAYSVMELPQITKEEKREIVNNSRANLALKLLSPEQQEELMNTRS